MLRLGAGWHPPPPSFFLFFFVFREANKRALWQILALHEANTNGLLWQATSSPTCDFYTQSVFCCQVTVTFVYPDQPLNMAPAASPPSTSPIWNSSHCGLCLRSALCRPEESEDSHVFALTHVTAAADLPLLLKGRTHCCGHPDLWVSPELGFIISLLISGRNRFFLLIFDPSWCFFLACFKWHKYWNDQHKRMFCASLFMLKPDLDSPDVPPSKV